MASASAKRTAKGTSAGLVESHRETRETTETQELSGCVENQLNNGIPQDKAFVPSRSGTVTNIPLLYDIYGTGAIKIMFLTGVALSRESWRHQVSYFASKPEYSCLVVENRGFDDYEACIPLKGASTKQLARDMRNVLQEIGWDQPKSIHVVGFSLGGMVALQMGRICPEYIASMHLVSAAKKYKRPSGKLQDMFTTLHLLKSKTDTAKADHLVDSLLSRDYLYADDMEIPEGGTNRTAILDQQAGEFFARGQRKWNLCTQVVAFHRHSMSKSDLWEVAAKVRFIFVSGAEDDLILNPRCSQVLMIGLNAQGRVYPGGHMVHWEHRADFNADQEAMMLRASREYTEYPPQQDLFLRGLLA